MYLTQFAKEGSDYSILCSWEKFNKEKGIEDTVQREVMNAIKYFRP